MDYQQVVYWLNLSADQKYSKAECTLGYMYYKGTEIPQDMTMAINLLKSAADHGDIDAALVLGQLYVHGREGYLPKDIHTKAIAYLNQAQEGGEEQSAEILGMIYYRDLKKLQKTQL